MIISVIIPAKNEECNIGKCLHALKSHFNLIKEVIVIDNGSTDDTVNVAKIYTDKIFIKPNFSISELRNFGAKEAIGDIFAFIDADCIVDKNWSSEILATLLDDKIGCTGSTPVAPVNGTWVEKTWSSFRARRKKKCYTPWINSSNFIVRKNLFFRVNGFSNNLETCEDVDICMRLNNICKILFNPSIKVTHLGEPKTIKQFFLKEMWRGKGTISGIFNHGIRASEIKSIFIPFYYLVILVFFIISLLFNNIIAAKILIFLYLLPAFMFSAWMILISNEICWLFQYVILFLLYANARVFSLLLRKQ